jgi:hypothetical protein
MSKPGNSSTAYRNTTVVDDDEDDLDDLDGECGFVIETDRVVPVPCLFCN